MMKNLLRMKRVVFTILFLFVNILPGVGQTNSILDDSVFTAGAEQGLDLLYNMKFGQADSVFTRISARHPDHPVVPFMKALNVWWMILLDLSDESHDKRFLAFMDEVIERSDRRFKQDKDDLDAMFFKGGAFGFRARLYADRDKWFKSALNGKRALSYVQKLAKIAPDNDDIYFGIGIYDYYADVIPKRYPFLKPFKYFFPRGDRQRGLDELQRVADNGRFVQTEAIYFLLLIYHRFENDFTKSLEYVNWLRMNYPDNAFFHKLEARIYLRRGRWNQAYKIFKDILVFHKEEKTGYNDVMAEQALYYLAQREMSYRRYINALEYFEQLELISEKQPRDTFYIISGRLKQGMVYDALGRRNEAIQRYNNVLTMKNMQNTHERARRYLKQPYPRFAGD